MSKLALLAAVFAVVSVGGGYVKVVHDDAAEYRRRVAVLEEERAQAEAGIAKMTEKVRALEEQVAKLAALASDAEASATKQQEYALALEAELDRARSDLSVAKERLRRVEGVNRELQRDNDIKVKTISQLQMDLLDLEVRIAALQDVADRANPEWTQADQERLAQLLSSILRLQREPNEAVRRSGYDAYCSRAASLLMALQGRPPPSGKADGLRVRIEKNIKLLTDASGRYCEGQR